MLRSRRSQPCPNPESPDPPFFNNNNCPDLSKRNQEGGPLECSDHAATTTRGGERHSEEYNDPAPEICAVVASHDMPLSASGVHIAGQLHHLIADVVPSAATGWSARGVCSARGRAMGSSEHPLQQHGVEMAIVRYTGPIIYVAGAQPRLAARSQDRLSASYDR